MSLKPPFTELEITKEPSGFYKGTSLPIALISKISITALVLWALITPGNASNALSAINGTLLNSFNSFYIVAVGLFCIFSVPLSNFPSHWHQTFGRTRRQTGIFQFFSVFHDVRRWIRCWIDGICNRRAIRFMGI